MDIQVDNIKSRHKSTIMEAGTNSTILVHAPKNIKTCSFCGSELQIEEGVMVFDRKWFHENCWSSYEKQLEDVKLD